MTTSLFVLLRVRLLSERERVQDRGETTTRCRLQGGERRMGAVVTEVISVFCGWD